MTHLQTHSDPASRVGLDGPQYFTFAIFVQQFFLRWRDRVDSLATKERGLLDILLKN
ncbi:hypothetical protein IE4803_PC00590 (plasmid) [Rhizobium etli bv. phaseoli str. IE4803]|nr:hypothetical protein IE4803_PC00590 [Rhizobium etli bv. phaseoli str. IE4803]